ncbi:hypothetical protein, partial [Acinetobacter baumannii]|uniref:hypothetical protein n=1 Tax=Acinetobacter baumannii TaxID=470 RepID=UPI00196ACDBB
EWVHVQLHQQKGMISLSPPTICNSAKIRLINSFSRNPVSLSSWLSSKKQRILAFYSRFSVPPR